MRWLKKQSREQSRVGIVLGADHVTLAHVENRQGRPHLLNCISAPSGAEKPAAEVLARLVSDLNLKGKLCNFVLASRDYHLHLIEAPVVDDSELRAAARWKVKDLLDHKPEDVVIDLFRVPHQAYHGRDMIYVVASPKVRIQAIVDMLERCNLQIESIDIPELVIRNLATQFVGDQSGVAFLDLRNNGSTMNITRGGEVYLSRRINSKLDANIMQSPKWPETKSRLVLEIQRSLDYYESQMGMPAIETLILVQRRYDGVALAEALSDELNTKVQILDLEKGLSSDVSMPPSLQQVASIAIGATLRQFGDLGDITVESVSSRDDEVAA